MTVTSPVARNDYLSSGITGPYPFTFPIQAASHLVVLKRNLTTGVETTLVQSVDYTLAGTSWANGGSWSLLATLASGYALTARRVVPLTQLIDLRNQGAFFAEVHESEFDLLVQADQQQQDQLDRSIKLPASEAGSALTTTLPAVELRANRGLGFDSLGRILMSDLSSPGSVIASGTLTTRTLAERFAEVFNVRDFGAKGDGSTNDTVAFAATATAVNAAGGGKIIIPPGTYIVGLQTFAGVGGLGYSYNESDILKIQNCTKPVIIEGYGAILKAANGLKFGSFDPVTGLVYNPGALPFTDANYRADAYWGMVELRGNLSVVVRGLELDGNQANLSLGGYFGDTGRQVAANGIYAYGNSRVLLEDVYAHHHGLDGIIFGYTGLVETDAATPHTMINVRSEYNARQGFSWVGGIGMTAINCKFNHTGKGTFSSSPGAGIDIEAESSVCRRGMFINCEAINNTGVGMVADSGDGGYSTFHDCLFWGTTAYALWANKPGLHFYNCRIYGSPVNAFGSIEPHKRTKFVDCEFEDKTHPTYGVYSTGGVTFDWGAVGGYDVIRCSFISNNSRGPTFKTLETVPEYAAQVRQCRIMLKAGTDKGIVDTDYQVLLAGVLCEDLVIDDAYSVAPATGYYVNGFNNNVWFGDNCSIVSVSGKTRWRTAAGEVGIMPKGQRQETNHNGRRNVLRSLMLSRSTFVAGGDGNASAIFTATGSPQTTSPWNGLTWVVGDFAFDTAPVIGGHIGWTCVVAGTPGTWARVYGAYLEGSATYDPPSLADGAGATTTVTVTGAALGDFADVSFSLDLQGITVTAYVSAANTVTVRFQNESGGVLDLGSGTLRARVRKF